MVRRGQDTRIHILDGEWEILELVAVERILDDLRPRRAVDGERVKSNYLGKCGVGRPVPVRNTQLCPSSPVRRGILPYILSRNVTSVEG